jgi:uncharacterized membrane protein YccF (DUF307 family)
VLVGWGLAIGHLVSSFLLAITIIGIPLSMANPEACADSLAPFGRTAVRVERAVATGATFSDDRFPDPTGLIRALDRNFGPARDDD